ncbi:mannitol dehydrogenase family protein [Histidinibacterium lentulum]|uniref:Mannitol dehydrogenase family protein n=1 Tax=Histidinibacterium lentulum TaxID=2480588 RepID=A0A3N2QYE9_9RHOB|nr:mannitol dehydrogenase family protein [Histidinibacterium lentulum]ROU00235.1 mannitol dehydrogenase family protein [Histidinibacterium lentulum]
MSPTPIVQFGTSRFLQAHVDLFVAEAMREGRALGPITVVQSSGDAARARRLQALAQGYEVKVRGLRNGVRVDESVTVRSVTRTMSLAAEVTEVSRVLAEEATVIVSNTADAGFRPRSEDSADRFDPAMSYPAKLVHLLRQRYETGREAPQVMPTELVQANGDVLRGLVLDAATGQDRSYRDWLAEEVTWVNSLVDRIVSEAIEPAGAVAEPYALWAVENRAGLVLPCEHRDIDVVADLGPIARRKLFVLNLGHTWIVSQWLARDRSGATHVRDVMADPAWVDRLRALYAEEVLPAFQAAGEADGLQDYMEVTLERFANPFLEHRLDDIAQNHVEKLQRRIGAFIDWARGNGDRTEKRLLEAALAGEAA